MKKLNGKVCIAQLLRLIMQVKFILPYAPILLPNGARAWYPLQQRALETLPSEFFDSSSKLRNFVENIAMEHNLPLSRVVIGGFSQV